MRLTWPRRRLCTLLAEAEINYYERHIGDYLKDTAHLSLLEHGIYGRLLDIYYTREEPIPEAQVMRLVGARSPEECSAVRDVLNEFFTRDGDLWRHTRCDKELSKYQDKQRKAKASADARWSKDKAHTERNANAMRTHCEGNAPSNQTPVTSTSSNEEVDSGPAQRSEPPPPPPPFDGNNAEALNGKSIVLLSGGWELPTDWGEDAERLGWKPAEILLQAEKFRQYWTAGKGKGTRRAVKGWRQTWSNWLARAAESRR